MTSPFPARPTSGRDVPPRRSGSRPDTTIAYGDDRMQKVDVWRPAGAGPFKTVLMVHGGCWQTAVADRSLMDWIAADLRDAGYAVWNIDYRGESGRASCRERVCTYV